MTPDRTQKLAEGVRLAGRANAGLTSDEIRRNRKAFCDHALATYVELAREVERTREALRRKCGHPDCLKRSDNGMLIVACDDLVVAVERAEQAEAALALATQALEELREMAGLWKQVDARSGPEGPRAQSVGWFAAAKARASMVYNHADEALKPRATDGSGE